MLCFLMPPIYYDIILNVYVPMSIGTLIVVHLIWFTLSGRMSADYRIVACVQDNFPLVS